MLILWSPVLQGSWCGDSCVVMDNHTLHTVANGGDAWDDPWEKVWQVPWVGAACLWGEAGSLDCGATATDMWSWSGHCVHGHWRKITAENPWPCVPTQKTLQKHQDHLLHHDLWFCSFCAVSPSQLQYHLWHILGCSNHVSQVINQQLKSTSQLNQPSYKFIRLFHFFSNLC